MLTIKEVFERTGNDIVSLVVDEPIYYMVLNTKLNIQGLAFLKKVDQIIKQVENTNGQAVLVTINSGPKVFSAGMDLKFWAKNYWN